MSRAGGETPYHVARERVALADLSHQATVLLSGADRVSWLQQLISNDLDLLTPDRGLSSLLLSAKGKTQAMFYIYRQPSVFILETEQEDVALLMASLLRYKLRSKIEVTQPPWSKFLIAGPLARTLLGCFLEQSLPDMQERSYFQSGEFFCIQRSLTGERDYLLYLPSAQQDTVWERLLRLGKEMGIEPVDDTMRERLRIEAGIPRWGKEITESVFPIETGLDEAISYTKGCYPGQEVMARIRTYGHVNRRLVGLILGETQPPQEGVRLIRDGEDVGWITSVTDSPALCRMIAMGYVREAASAAGTDLSIAETALKAQVVALPFLSQQTSP